MFFLLGFLIKTTEIKGPLQAEHSTGSPVFIQAMRTVCSLSPYGWVCKCIPHPSLAGPRIIDFQCPEQHWLFSLLPLTFSFHMLSEIPNTKIRANQDLNSAGLWVEMKPRQICFLSFSLGSYGLFTWPFATSKSLRANQSIPGTL